jgi:pyridoxamine 5'-phosphate oxidase
LKCKAGKSENQKWIEIRHPCYKAPRQMNTGDSGKSLPRLGRSVKIDSFGDLPLNELTSRDFTNAVEPCSLFKVWFEAAQKSEPSDPDAMALATADASGLPNVRMVLLKEFDSSGFVFYTNSESAKGQELQANMQAAAVLHWKSLRRQVRFRGPVTPVSDADADAYFASRPLQARIGAWASQQSRPLKSRFALEKAAAKYAAKFALGHVPRPPYWVGYRILPLYIEFWAEGAFRLHDRIVFRRQTELDAWQKERLYP